MGAGRATLLVFLACFCGCLSQSVIQSKISVTRGVGKTARFRCSINTKDFSNTAVHWYRDVGSLGLQRILYVQTNSGIVRDEGSTGRFVAEILEKEKASLLDIRDIEKMDAGVYYCAIWDSTAKRHYRSPEQIPCAQARVTPGRGRLKRQIRFDPRRLNDAWTHDQRCGYWVRAQRECGRPETQKVQNLVSGTTNYLQEELSRSSSICGRNALGRNTASRLIPLPSAQPALFLQQIVWSWKKH